jgi:hypothetical protein
MKRNVSNMVSEKELEEGLKSVEIHGRSGLRATKKHFSTCPDDRMRGSGSRIKATALTGMQCLAG